MTRLPENKIRQQFLEYLTRDHQLFNDYQHVTNFYELDHQILTALTRQQSVLAEQLLETLTLDLLKLPQADEYRSVRLYFMGLTFQASRMIPVDSPDVNVSLTYTSALLSLIETLQTPVEYMYAIPVIVEGLTTVLSPLASSASSNPHIVKAIRLIEDRLTDCTLTPVTVAEQVGVSHHYLSVLFREEVGESLFKRIRRRRIDASLTELIGTSHSICSIAETYCFPSCSAYIHTFKSYKQMTPLQYRQLFQLENAPRR